MVVVQGAFRIHTRLEKRRQGNEEKKIGLEKKREGKEEEKIR